MNCGTFLAHVSLPQVDLKQIGRHIAKESWSRNSALDFLDKIADTCETSAMQSAAGDLCPDLGEDVRRFSIGNYVVFSSPRRDGITILHVLDIELQGKASDLPRLSHWALGIR